MRTNLPVTDNEYLLQDGTMLVSSTDLNGVITFCNRNFIEASGYSEKELLGQPHNLVRHPHMPAEAFEDMWENLKNGKSWSSIVKNRRKNGDFYWVMAKSPPCIMTEWPQATCPYAANLVANKWRQLRPATEISLRVMQKACASRPEKSFATRF